MKNERKNVASFLFVFISYTIVLLIIEISLALYLYTLMRQNLHEEFLQAIQKGVFKAEFKRLINEELYLTTDFVNLESQDRNVYKNFKNYEDFIKKRTSDPHQLRRFRRRTPIYMGYGLQPISTHPGPPGSQGREGPSGKLGPKGEIGPAGPPGPPGPIGPQGLLGLQGVQGVPGPTGLKGNKGEVGADGQIGLQGPNGDVGIKGSRGESGLQGPPGQKGERGDSGFPGQPGFNGRDGLIGSKGEKGDEGTKGSQGLPGLPGLQGAIGVRGLPGYCSEYDKKFNKINTTIIVKHFGNTVDSNSTINKTVPTLLSIGPPDFYGAVDYQYSSWMVDSSPVDEVDKNKVWVTSKDNFKLLEFVDIKSLKANKPSRTYDLNIGFDGNANIIYKGFFFYKINRKKPRIIKYDLKNDRIESLNMEDMITKEMNQLYLANHNYFDFNVDKNGLWVTFSVSESKTSVAKIDHDHMKVDSIWEVNLSNKNFIDTFVISGVLYTLEYTSSDQIEIGLGLNLLLNKVMEIHLDGFQQTGGITMANYNSRLQKLLIVDNGERIAYPVRLDDEDVIVPPE